MPKLSIEFPNYFHGNEKFLSKKLKNAYLVRYFHSLDDIVDVELGIKQTFILFIKKGRAHLRSDEEEITIGENQAALVCKGSYVMSEDLSENDNQFYAVLFFLQDEIIENFFYSIDEMKKVQSEDVKSDFAFIEMNEMVLNFYNGIENLLNHSPKLRDNEFLIYAKTIELLHYIMVNDQNNKIVQILKKSLNKEVHHIRKVMEMNYLNNYNLEELANLCQLSLSTFKRKFEEIYNSSPGKWIRSKRLKHSQDLLKNEHLTIQEIADQCSFKSAAHFSSAYRNKYGMPPSIHRMQKT